MCHGRNANFSPSRLTRAKQQSSNVIIIRTSIYMYLMGVARRTMISEHTQIRHIRPVHILCLFKYII